MLGAQHRPWREETVPIQRPIRPSTAQYSPALHGPVRSFMDRSGPAQPSTEKPSPAQPGTNQRCPVRSITAPPGPPRSPSPSAATGGRGAPPAGPREHRPWSGGDGDERGTPHRAPPARGDSAAHRPVPQFPHCQRVPGRQRSRAGSGRWAGGCPGVPKQVGCPGMPRCAPVCPGAAPALPLLARCPADPAKLCQLLHLARGCGFPAVGSPRWPQRPKCSPGPSRAALSIPILPAWPRGWGRSCGIRESRWSPG